MAKMNFTLYFRDSHAKQYALGVEVAVSTAAPEITTVIGEDEQTFDLVLPGANKLDYRLSLDLEAATYLYAELEKFLARYEEYELKYLSGNK